MIRRFRLFLLRRLAGRDFDIYMRVPGTFTTITYASTASGAWDGETS